MAISTMPAKTPGESAKREAAIIGARDGAQKVLREAEELRTKFQKDEIAAAERHRIEFERARKEADAIIAQARESMDRAAADRRAPFCGAASGLRSWRRMGPGQRYQGPVATGHACQRLEGATIRQPKS